MATQVETQTQLQQAGHSRVSHTQLSGIDLQSSPASFFHQKIRSNTGQNRYSNTIAFNGAGLGQDNRIYLPSISVMPESLVLEFNMTDASGPPTNPKYMPTTFWVASNGVRLLYKNTVIYHASQAEVEAEFYLNNDTHELWQQQTISNDTSTRSGSSGLYYLNLQVLMKVFSHIGALDAYDANAWSIEVDLKPSSQIVSGDGTSTPGVASIKSLNLIIIGHQSSPEFSTQIRNKLNSSGLMVQYLQSNNQRDTYPENSTSKTVTLNQLEGNVAGMFILHRNKDRINAKSGGDGLDSLDDSDKSVVDKIYQVFNDPNDMIEVGRSSNPVELYGRAIPERQLRLVLNNNGTFAGLPNFVNASGENKEKNIVAISMADKFSSDSKFGQSSGHLYVKNDLQFTYRWSSLTNENYIDTIVYIHRFMVLRSDGVFSNNSY